MLGRVSLWDYEMMCKGTKNNYTKQDLHKKYIHKTIAL